VGKTRFAIDLATAFNAQIVGADSMQIYRHMDIGTAKPTPAERAEVRHHLVDFLEPNAPFDAAAYGLAANKVIQDLLSQQILPLVVGGTGLYIKSLIYGLFDSKPSDPSIRKRLQDEGDQKGSAVLHARLADCDPDAAARIHPNDTYRIIRALEVVAVTGHSLTSLQAKHGFKKARYQTLTIGLTMPRERLYARIDKRVDLMLAQGLKDEVAHLLDTGVSANLKPMQALGYRHMVDFLEGRQTWDETLRTLKRDHRRYAKRQLTWFGALDGIHWLSPEQSKAARDMLEEFLSDTSGL
jgi:tRNA dimethylallyltransferase